MSNGSNNQEPKKVELSENFYEKNRRQKQKTSVDNPSLSKGSADKKKNEIEILKEELEKIKKQNEEHLNGWRRAKADYLNLKKETEEKSRKLIQFANVGLILQILPIYENFKTAWNHIPGMKYETWNIEQYQKFVKDIKNWSDGIGHIKKQLKDFLKNLGLEPIKTVGEKFDHNLHEAVGSEKREDKEDDIILKEVKGGFKLYDKVLEHAKVVVVKNS